MKALLNKIKIDEKIYPRRSDGTFEINHDVVNAYKLNLLELPPIVVSSDFTLIDGYHRYLAHRDSGVDEIEIEVIDIVPEQYLIEAIKRNAKHGLQLTRAQKYFWANQLCHETEGKETRTKLLEMLPDLLAISHHTILEWTRRTREELEKEETEERNRKIMELYLRCYSSEEIAEVAELSDAGVRKIISQLKEEKSSELQNPPEGFQPYTLLSFSQCKKEYGRDDYPGRMPGQIIEHLLWYYTELFDIVLDPMAGSGTTVDVCKAMYRRYQAYDLIKDESKGIEEHDIVKDGVPHRKNFPPQLIILDPPYWSQKEDSYVAQETGLAKMPLDRFYEAMSEIVEQCTEILVSGGYLAVIISPSQIAGKIYDHIKQIWDFIESQKNLVYGMRFIVPYTTQQVRGFDVKAAIEKKYPLKLHRDLLVYRKQ